MSYQTKHSSNPPVENLNLPKVKLIKSYKANSHFTVENMNLHKVKLILNCQSNFQLRETRPFNAKNLTHSN